MFKKLISTGFLFGILASSCTKTSVDIHEENELITTVKLQFSADGKTETFSYSDKDGDGGMTPKIDDIVLEANKKYVVSVQVLDESKTPAEDITQDITENKEEHLFVFTPSPASLITYSYGDKDKNGFPVGLLGNITTNSVGVGKVKVQLRHQPLVNGKISKDGTANPGSDDVNIEFNLLVK